MPGNWESRIVYPNAAGVRRNLCGMLREESPPLAAGSDRQISAYLFCLWADRPMSRVAGSEEHVTVMSATDANKKSNGSVKYIDDSKITKWKAPKNPDIQF